GRLVRAPPRADLRRGLRRHLVGTRTGTSPIPVLVEPGHLDRFQDLFIRPLRVVTEGGELGDVAMQVREPHRERIHIREFLAQRDSDVLGVPPAQAHEGISTTTSPPTTAWQPRREW